MPGFFCICTLCRAFSLPQYFVRCFDKKKYTSQDRRVRIYLHRVVPTIGCFAFLFLHLHPLQSVLLPQYFVCHFDSVLPCVFSGSSLMGIQPESSVPVFCNNGADILILFLNTTVSCYREHTASCCRFCDFEEEISGSRLMMIFLLKTKFLRTTFLIEYLYDRSVIFSPTEEQDRFSFSRRRDIHTEVGVIPSSEESDIRIQQRRQLSLRESYSC